MASGARIIRYEERPVVERGADVVTSPLVTQAAGAETFISGVTQIPPGHAIPRHLHNCDEQVVVLAGGAEVEADGVTDTVKPFDAVFIKAGTWHRFRNSGAQPLTILWIYGAVHVTRTFDDGRTVAHLSTEDIA